MEHRRLFLLWIEPSWKQTEMFKSVLNGPASPNYQYIIFILNPCQGSRKPRSSVFVVTARRTNQSSSFRCFTSKTRPCSPSITEPVSVEPRGLERNFRGTHRHQGLGDAGQNGRTKGVHQDFVFGDGEDQQSDRVFRSEVPQQRRETPSAGISTKSSIKAGRSNRDIPLQQNKNDL